MKKKLDGRIGQNTEKAREALKEYIKLGKIRRLEAQQAEAQEDSNEEEAEELVFSMEDLQELNGEIEEEEKVEKQVEVIIGQEPIKEDKYKSMFETLQNDFKTLKETVSKLKSEPPKDRVVEKVIIKEKTSNEIMQEALRAKLRASFFN